ncbi:MAG: glycosyltransferase family 1 protein [Anaerolineae bacterium]|nr:glycosyltransferase family 1 protein [Anaerolineae bacterium]
MRIAVDGLIYQLQSGGGISRLFSEILPRMCELDDSLRIALFTEGRLKQELPKHRHITHLAIPPMKRYLRPRGVWGPIIPEVRRFVRRLWIGHGRGQIWHSTYYTLPEKWEGAQVVTVYDMIHERFGHLFQAPEAAEFRERKRACVWAAQRVICISQATSQDLQHLYGVDAARIHVIPPGRSEAFAPRPSSRASPTAPFLLYVGSRARYKNFHGLVKAYSAWPGRDEVRLVVVGQDWSMDESRLLQELWLAGRVHLLTDVDDEALCGLYNQAAAFVLPSLYEGFGIPLLEAMACGCPIVASRIPSTLEVAGDCPVYFEPAAMDSLWAALDLALSEGRDSTRVRQGLQRVQRYSWDQAAQQTLEVYRAALEEA